jgi:hypothetical protein
MFFSRRQDEKKDPIVDAVKEFVKASSTDRTRGKL